MARVFEMPLDSWSEYGPTVDRIVVLVTQERSKQSIGFPAELFYRGLGDARWGLDTSLDRIGKRRISMSEYWSKAYFARPRIEAFTDREWMIWTPNEYHERLQKGLFPQPSVEMQYLCYLRHHGFPSPLLDWTMSPYVAAFFAFEQPPTDSERVVVYAYCYSSTGNHAGADAAPEIYPVLGTLRTHRRHFLQQSRYTFCVVRNKDSWDYARHDYVFFENSEFPILDAQGQDSFGRSQCQQARESLR